MHVTVRVEDNNPHSVIRQIRDYAQNTKVESVDLGILDWGTRLNSTNYQEIFDILCQKNVKISLKFQSIGPEYPILRKIKAISLINEYIRILEPKNGYSFGSPFKIWTAYNAITRHKTINLSGFDIDDSLLKKLIDVLKNNDTVQTIKLFDCQLSIKCISMFAELLRMNTKNRITFIDLRGNFIKSSSKKDFDPLIDVLKNGSKYGLWIALGRNYLDQSVCDYIKKLNFSGTNCSLTTNCFSTTTYLENPLLKNEYIGEKRCFVYLARDNRDDKDYNHVMLFLHGITEFGQGFLMRADLTKHGDTNSKFYLSSMFMGSKATVRVSSLDPVRLLSSWKQYKYRAWHVDYDKIKVLKEAIEKEEGKPIRWKHCLSWAKEKLGLIGIKFDADNPFLILPTQIIDSQVHENAEKCCIL